MPGTDLPAAATWGRLATFLAVYEAGSVRGAAEALHVTPPAVSAAIAALDDALGTPLFSKAGRGIVPTDAGEIFAGYVRKLRGLRPRRRSRAGAHRCRGDGQRLRAAAADGVVHRGPPPCGAVAVGAAPGRTVL